MYNGIRKLERVILRNRPFFVLHLVYFEFGLVGDSAGN